MKRLKNFVVFAAVLLLSGCGKQEQGQITSLKQEISELQVTKQSLEIEISRLNDEVVEIKEKNGTAKYILTLEIKQSHFSLDISEHLKDAINAIEIQIPVDKEYYDSLEVGQKIADEFRLGSLVMKGTFGDWEIKVVGKEIQ